MHPTIQIRTWPKEGVFEIRDFTNASTFERLSHQISLAARHWAQALSSERSEPGQPGQPGPLRTEEVLQMKHGFELGGFRRGESQMDVTIWLFHIAMENGPFIDDFPSYKPSFIGDSPWLC